MIAPYWDDIDLSSKGLVLYAALIQGQDSHLNNSLNIVNGYVTDTVLNGAVFKASWILAVRWIETCPYGNSNCILVCINYLLLLTNFVLKL